MGQSLKAFMDEPNIPKSANDDNALGTSLEEDSWSDLEMRQSEEVNWKQRETKATGVVPKLVKMKSIFRTGKTNEVNYWGPTLSLPSFNDTIWTKKEISKRGSMLNRPVLRTGPPSLNKYWGPTSSSKTRIALVKRSYTIENFSTSNFTTFTLNTAPLTTLEPQGSKVALGLARPYRRFRHGHGHALGHKRRHRYRHRHAHQGHRKKETKTTKSDWFLKNCVLELADIPRINSHQIDNHKRYSIKSYKNIIVVNKTARNTKELEAIIKRNKKVLESERREEMKHKKKPEAKVLNLRDPKVRGVVKDLLQRVLSRKREKKRDELSIENDSYEFKRNVNKALEHNMSTKFKKDAIRLNFNNRKIRKVSLTDFSESSHGNLERVFKRKLRLGFQKRN